MPISQNTHSNVHKNELWNGEAYLFENSLGNIGNYSAFN
jgi:hypothetical protein